MSRRSSDDKFPNMSKGSDGKLCERFLPSGGGDGNSSRDYERYLPGRQARDQEPASSCEPSQTKDRDRDCEEGCCPPTGAFFSFGPSFQPSMAAL